MRGKLLVTLGMILINYPLFTQINSGYVTVAASSKYRSSSFLKKLIAGTNYRQEWGTPVKMPVFDLQKSKLRIKELGGGQQTTSLYLLDENNREWVLRSVDKDYKPPKKIIQNTFIERIIEDHISASYPYASLSVSHLSKAAGIHASESRVYFVPDDSAFGEYRSLMANKVFMLISYQPDSVVELTTDEMLQKLSEDKNRTIDQKEYLKVRLVDWLISDWDRHDGQYKWVKKTINGDIVYRVIPRDRDQAFFRSNGRLLKFLSLFITPHMEGFMPGRNDIKRLSRKARGMDKVCTGQLTKEDWINITKEFQYKMSDDVITDAIKKQPPEIFAIRGKEIIEILKARRNNLLENVMNYYTTLNG